MKLLILVIFNLAVFGNAANILYLSNIASPSHFIWCKSLLYSLHQRGHNITALSVDVEKSQENFTFLHLDGIYPLIYNDTGEELDFFDFNDANAWDLLKLYYDFSQKCCLGSINSNGYKQLLEYPDDFKFDLAFFDFTMDPCLLGILQKFKNLPPLIGLSAFHSPGQFGANLIYPAFVPVHDKPYPAKMNFQERFSTTLLRLLEYFSRVFVFTPMVYKIVRKIHPNIQYLGDFQKNVKFYFVNNDPIVDYPQPIFANQKNVGGMQIKEPKELPNDLKIIFDEAQNGVIYFSLGSNVRSDSMKEEIVMKFLKTFSRLEKFTFVWKFETIEKLPMKLPKNVYIQDWMPQNDILAHPNTKLFISHCGLLSVQESLWFGVPILGFPVFADQPQNALRMKELGVGEKIKILDFTEDELYETIKNMIENPKYREKIDKISKALRDKPISALEEATYWSEWLMRNPEIDLEGPAADMSLFVRHSFDVFSVLLLVFIMILYVKIKIVIFIVELCKRKNSKKIKVN